MTTRKGALILVGSLFALLLILGGTAAIVQAIDLRDTGSEDTAAAIFQDADSPGHHHGFGDGKHGFHHQLEGVTPLHELLAIELDISVEALNEAMAEAHAAARERADEEGYFHGRDAATKEEHLALLAEALGRPVEELEAAHAAARDAFLAELVEAGFVTQEQIDLMEARRALGETIDRQMLLAEALGIELAELQAARESGATLRELLGDMSLEDFAAAYEAAYEAAVLQAAADGVITDAQAEEILSDGFGYHRGFGPGHGFGHGHGYGHGHGHGGGHFGPGGSRGFGPGRRGPAPAGVSL